MVDETYVFILISNDVWLECCIRQKHDWWRVDFLFIEPFCSCSILFYWELTFIHDEKCICNNIIFWFLFFSSSIWKGNDAELISTVSVRNDDSLLYEIKLNPQEKTENIGFGYTVVMFLWNCFHWCIQFDFWSFLSAQGQQIEGKYWVINWNWDD